MASYRRQYGNPKSGYTIERTIIKQEVRRDGIAVQCNCGAIWDTPATIFHIAEKHQIEDVIIAYTRCPGCGSTMDGSLLNGFNDNTQVLSLKHEPIGQQRPSVASYLDGERT